MLLADIDSERAAAVAAEHGAEVVDPDAILEAECDVLAPCALGAVLSSETIPRLRCRAVCGAANNQLADEHSDHALVSAGILYAPDFVVNAGGIINIAEEFVGYSRERAEARVAQIEQTTAKVLARAQIDHRPPGQVAADMARERIAREGKGRRWRPGDPAAWTRGEPLRSLRPMHPDVDGER